MTAAKLFLLCGAVSGLLAVALGAFGAHALRDRLPDNLIAAYQTGVQYQFYHALALLAVGLLARQLPTLAALSAAGYSFIAGSLLFSGSLYALALSGPRWLGPVTPLGGLLLIIGWAALAVAVLRIDA